MKVSFPNELIDAGLYLKSEAILAMEIPSASKIFEES